MYRRLLGALVIFLLFTRISSADTYTSFGVGVFSSAKDSNAESKFFNFGYREQLFDLTQQFEFGFWTDSVGNGRKGSGYLSYQLGVEVNPGILVTRFMAGPAIITTPDFYLGGCFPQFSEDLYIGVKDGKGKSMGLKYKHLSSAGLRTPNVGRDFLLIEAAIPF